MYNDCYLHPLLVDRLTQLEDELDLPIRVVTWNIARERDVLSWHSMSRRDLTLEQAAETGITIWAAGPRPTNHGWTDLRTSEFTIYESLRYHTEPASPVIYEDHVVGEIGERWVGLGFIPNDGYNIPEAFANAVTEAVKASVDPEFLAGWAERAEQRNREALENFVRRSYDSRFQIHRDSIDAHQRNIVNWQQSIVNSMRTVQRENEMLDALILARDNDAGDQFMHEWEQLDNHPRVENLRFVNGNSIEITTTDDLRLHHPVSGDSRWLGAFKINLAIDTMAVRMQNLSTRRGGRDHPHVIDGHPCFGGHHEAFTQLLSKGEIYTMFELLIQYLETLNLADEYGRYGAYWFDAPDERPLVVDEVELVTA